jgi:two-component system response regulator FixJ
MTGCETVHVVDDDAAVRDALRFTLETAGLAVCLHDSATAFLAAAPGASGCVLSDLRMPGMDGLALQERLAELGARLPIVLMTGQAEIPDAVRAMRAGAIDFLQKPFTEDELLAALRRALAEGRRLRDMAAARDDAASRLAALTPREREVLNLLVAGQPTKAIARTLGASPRTIEVHRGRVFEKLQAENLPELVHLVLAAGQGS